MKRAYVRNEVGGVIAFVGTNRYTLVPGQLRSSSSIAASRSAVPVAWVRSNADDQSIAVFHKRMAQISEYRAHRFTLPIKPRIRIRRGFVRIIFALRTPKIDVSIASATARARRRRPWV